MHWAKEALAQLTLIATMVATTIGGGSIIGQSSNLYQHGAWFFSIAEVMGRMYSAYARELVDITGLFWHRQVNEICQKSLILV